MPFDLIILFPKPLEPISQLRPPFPSYASWATSSANGAVYRAILSGPASTGSKPTRRVRDEIGKVFGAYAAGLNLRTQLFR